MLEKQVFIRPEQTDLGLFSYGFEDCRPAHRWGPGVRDHHLLHLIVSGQGKFCCPSGAYPLAQGEGFYIPPGEIVEYQADAQRPWSYLWVGFYGLQAEPVLAQAGLTRRQPILTCRRPQRFEKLVRAMLESGDDTAAARLFLTGHLYHFLAGLIEEAEGKEKACCESQQTVYVRQAVKIMASHYAKPLTIQSIADQIGLNRSYLHALFRKHLCMTPKDYLTQLRLQRAEDLLQTSLTISEIARSVGYDDPLLFSKTFKKARGIPPSHMRRENAK